MDLTRSQHFAKIDILLGENGSITRESHDKPWVMISGGYMIISTENNDSMTNTVYELSKIKVFKTYHK